MKANNLTVVEGVLSVHRFEFFFIDHLNRIYCAKCHLQERLSEISEHAHFTDLKDAINKTLANVEEDISRIDKIYRFLGLKYNFRNCSDVLTLIENSFVAVYQKSSNQELRDWSMLKYLENIESIELISSKVLQWAKPAIKTKEIRSLMKKNVNKSDQGLPLLYFIATRYLHHI